MQRLVLKTAGVTVLGLALLVTAVGLAVIYSGWIDVGAKEPHYALTKWVLETTMEHSVRKRARGIVVPAGYRYTHDTARHYGETCGQCHGAPGKEPSAIGKGQRPDPPDLAKVAGGMTEQTVFWVVKNGVRMTGMPAFGKTHKDAELWEMVSLVKSLPEMSASEYRKAGGI